MVITAQLSISWSSSEHFYYYLFYYQTLQFGLPFISSSLSLWVLGFFNLYHTLVSFLNQLHLY